MAAKAKRRATPSYDQPPIEALTTPFEPQTDQDRHGDALKPNGLRQAHINPTSTPHVSNHGAYSGLANTFSLLQRFQSG